MTQSEHDRVMDSASIQSSLYLPSASPSTKRSDLSDRFEAGQSTSDIASWNSVGSMALSGTAISSMWVQETRPVRQLLMEEPWQLLINPKANTVAVQASQRVDALVQMAAVNDRINRQRVMSVLR